LNTSATGDAADRNMSANARHIDNDERTVDDIQVATLDVENRQTVLDRNWA
jgi:hypothetical protein